MAQGYLALVLHNHLPYIRHPEYEDFLEERWLFEAMLETYLPLLKVLDNLNQEGIDYNITLSFSPTLLSMFNDPLLQKRFKKHTEKLLELGEKELSRTKRLPEHYLAVMYKNRFTEMYDYYLNRCKGNIINLLKELKTTNKIELITCSATHGFLPFMRKEGIKVQIALAVETYQKFFNDNPKGIWLPECAYIPGIEEVLNKYNIRYFFLDTHGVLFSNPPPIKQSVYAPVQCLNNVAVFGRDPESSKQVWSKDEGYPGDFNYREYYRDIGFDLPLDYIKPYIHPDGIRLNTGYKYYRITGKTNHKELYNPDLAREKAAEHAGNFMFNREKKVEHLISFMDKKPIIVAPFDGELFGHWWYEGPIWLDFLLRKIHYDQDNLKTITPSKYLNLFPDNFKTQPSLSSWGDKGYFEVWLNGSNDWIYKHLHKACDYMVDLADNYPHAEGTLKKALEQAARELLLAQSSDWAFIMKTNTMVEYAKKRTTDHLGRFFRLYQDIKNNNIDSNWLNMIASKNNIFPSIDYSLYSSNKY